MMPNETHSNLKTQPDRVSILGVMISPINMQQALNTVDNWVKFRQPHYVCCAPAHSIMECVDHPELLGVFNNSGLTTPDGMPVVWLCRWYGYPQADRVYGPDLLLAVCEHGLKYGYRHYFYGGAPGVAGKLVDRLETKFPDLQVVGIESPPFRPLNSEEEQAVRERMLLARPDFVWIGISSPKQEQWMAAHVNILNIPVMVGVGAAFDFLSGVKTQAPRWIQRSGFEWLFRLINEPGRLWRRYVMGYPRFVFLVLFQLLKGKG